MKCYKMGKGILIPEAGRGVTKKSILKIQEEEWAKKMGGISGISEITEPHAVYFVFKKIKD